MTWILVMKMLDADDNVLASEDITDSRIIPEIVMRVGLRNFEARHADVNWKKLSVVIEKV